MNVSHLPYLSQSRVLSRNMFLSSTCETNVALDCASSLLLYNMVNMW